MAFWTMGNNATVVLLIPVNAAMIVQFLDVVMESWIPTWEKLVMREAECLRIHVPVVLYQFLILFPCAVTVFWTRHSVKNVTWVPEMDQQLNAKTTAPCVRAEPPPPITPQLVLLPLISTCVVRDRWNPILLVSTPAMK